MKRESITGPLAGLLSGGGGAAAGAAGGSSGGGLFAGLGTFLAGLFHEGGIAGDSGVRSRLVDPAIFLGAPRYHSGGISETRTIAKPVAGTVKISVNGTPQASGWSVNAATGLVTFTAAPAGGAVITADFEFDYPPGSIPIRWTSPSRPMVSAARARSRSSRSAANGCRARS